MITALELVAYIPATIPPVLVAAVYMEPVPEVAPIVFPVDVPILALPAVTAIPQNTPVAAAAPLEV